MKSSAGYSAGIRVDDPTAAFRVQVTSLQETLSEVPVPQRELDVFLAIPMAALIKDGGDLVVTDPA
jgi:hypothetical protein